MDEEILTAEQEGESEDQGLLFHIEKFDGPLDLLLSLVVKNKIDIYDIPIGDLTEQYLDYLDKMRKMDMAIAGDFIAMAAELMLIKSRMMLPKVDDEEEEEDPRAALTRALIEYQKAKEAAEYLGERYPFYSDRIPKEADERYFEEIPTLRDQDIELLRTAFENVMQRYAIELRNAPTEKSEETLARLLRKRVVPVSQKIKEIVKRLKTKGRTSFSNLMMESEDKSELVASFIAVLELIRDGKISIAERTGNNDVILDIGEAAE